MFTKREIITPSGKKGVEYSYSYSFYDHGEIIIFEELSYDDIKKNLNIIMNINIGEKIMISDHKYLNIDKRPNVIRFLMNINRTKSFAMILHVYDQLLKYINKLNEDHEMKKYLIKSFDGLNNISETYGGLFMSEKIRSLHEDFKSILKKNQILPV